MRIFCDVFVCLCVSVSGLLVTYDKKKKTQFSLDQVHYDCRAAIFMLLDIKELIIKGPSIPCLWVGPNTFFHRTGQRVFGTLV